VLMALDGGQTIVVLAVLVCLIVFAVRGLGHLPPAPASLAGVLHACSVLI
jgi:ABC-type phosphate transport system auxiliary subunit